ncbi:hypothetical protein I8H84_00960 [Candidatus Saccharibacteria bacterium]|nr:hypothetical protein [Candidatus Saccharibacteria bacterium]MBH1972516.1 hypothetical protein [Candidatus Saccharibacteria bacterium]MBH1990718.1 hypothetical protein [Candidatus Saccharibacteria bacterium]
MVRRISSSQFRSQMRSAQNQLKRNLNKYNSAVNQYNRAIRQHNSQVKRNRARINSELRRLNSSYSTKYTVSVRTLNTAYEQVSTHYDNLESPTPFEDLFYSSVEQENANSIVTANTLDDQPTDTGDESLSDTLIADNLEYFSADLDKRWRGALFSLNPANPDAARHFCTSSREIFTDLIELKAADKEVFSKFPDCEKTERGNATRRSKIKYLLDKKGIASEAAEDFVEKDIQNIINLFYTLSDGTHGEAGKYNNTKLLSVKKRVEDGIIFLSNIARD